MLSKVLISLVFISSLVFSFFLGMYYKDAICGSRIDSLLKKIATKEPPKNVYQEYHPLNGNYKNYISKKLGVSFGYYEYGSGDSVKNSISVYEEGNKIYLYNQIGKTPNDFKQGIYLEVFTKNPNQSLENAVREKFLSGNTSEDCQIQEFNQKDTYKILNPTYSYNRIFAENLKGKEYDESTKIIDYCSGIHTSNRSMNYFVMDNNNPNKFAFVNLGQSNFGFFPSAIGFPIISWDMTLKFFN